MKSFIWVPVVAALMVTGAAQATLIVYEGFDYAAGPLAGKGAATDGWAGAWGSGTYNVVAGLTMPDLPFATIGGAAAGTGNINRSFTTSIDTDTEGVWYVSFLLQRTGWVATSGSDFAYLEFPWNAKADWGVASNDKFNTANIGDSAEAPGANTSDVVFIVGKLVTHAPGTPDQIFLKAYTTGSSIERAETANWTIVGGSEDGSGINTTLRLAAGTLAGYQATFDEIRIGTTWADVVPVPEPATALLLAAGMCSLLKRRR